MGLTIGFIAGLSSSEGIGKALMENLLSITSVTILGTAGILHLAENNKSLPPKTTLNIMPLYITVYALSITLGILLGIYSYPHLPKKNTPATPQVSPPAPKSSPPASEASPPAPKASPPASEVSPPAPKDSPTSSAALYSGSNKLNPCNILQEVRKEILTIENAIDLKTIATQDKIVLAKIKLIAGSENEPDYEKAFDIYVKCFGEDGGSK
jgi:hypothetical protein